jgi:hypothetical protein
VQNQCVVELRKNVALGYILDFSEINNQSLLGMLWGIVDFTGNGYMQTVGMSVDILARPIVTVQCVSHFEVELFGYADFLLEHFQ